MKYSWTNPLKALPVLLFVAAYAGAALGAVGNVQFVIGDAKLVNKAGVSVALQKGAEINEGDRIVTAAGASAQIKMVDGGFIAVRPDTNMGFDTYRYSGKEDGTESAVVSLLQGGFRTITGLIGRTNKQNYLIKTVTATIGIRGTDHEPMVILPPAPGQTAIAAPGTYDKVNVGVAFIRTDAGSVDIQRNQVGFAPVTKAAPVILPRIPPFYKPTPAPGPQKAKEEAKDEGKKDNQQSAAAASGKSGEEKKDAAPAEKAAATAAAPTEQAAAPAPAEKAAEAPPAPIRSTAVVDPASAVTVSPAAAPVVAAPAAIAPVVAIQATDASGSTVNTTTQTLTSSTGGTTSVSQGTFALDAQTAADAAAAAAAALNTLSTTAGSALTSTGAAAAVSAAQTAVNSAAAAGTSIAALTIDTGLAASNAAAAASVASAASSQVSASTAKFNANGAFADATIAVPAFAALNAANAILQTANGNAQSAAGAVTTQSSTLTAAQAAASATLSGANQALSAANGALTALTAAGVPTTSSVASLLSVAQTAAAAAQSAAAQAQSLQSAGDFTGAQAQLALAQAQALAATNALTNAAQVITAVGSANAALSAAASITAASLSAASSAQSAGASAVGTTATELAAAQAQGSVVQQNSVLAQYSNPAVASGNFVTGLAGSKAVTGGIEQLADGASMLSTNTNYVLDGSKNLAEIRNLPYERSGINYSSALIHSADITFSGGTAKDQANDPNGVYYFGRWQGGQINVKDLATTGAVAPFSEALGSASAHWIVGLVPGNSTLPGTAGGPINNTQQIVGTANYALAAATHPTDALGNVGTLSSASLAANFSAQTVDAALGVTFSTADAVNVSTRNLNISASANKVPISASGFEAKTGMPYAPVISCTSTSGNCAAAGYVGGFGGQFLSTASAGSSTGAVGPGAALMYKFAPSIAAAPANQPYTDLIQGLAVLSSGAAPANGVTNSFPNNANVRDEVRWITNGSSTLNPLANTFIVSDKNKQNLFFNSGGTPSTPLTTALTTPVTIAGPTANTNYLFDAAGNLVRVFDTPHVVFDHGNDVPGNSTQFAAPTPLANAQLSFGGGAAASENYYDPGTNIRLGRWTGGTVNVTDLATGNSYVESLVGPGGAARSVQWMVGQMPSALPVTGEFHYTRINNASGVPSFATAPTDSYGNIGTIEGARLSADFTNMRASAGVRISMPSGTAGALGTQNLSSRFDNAPISNGGFNVSSGSGNPAGTDNLHVSCFGSGCAANQSYGGRIRGGFDSASGGATADGGFFRYTFNTNYGASGAGPVPAGRLVDDYIDGLVAFKQGPQIALPTSAAYPAAAPTGPVVVVANYGYSTTGGNIFGGGHAYWLAQPSAINPATSTKYLVTDAAGNLVSLTEDDSSMHGDGRALALSGGTASPATPTALAIGSTASATDGSILLGWQAPSPNLTVSGNDYNGCFGTAGCTLAPSPRIVLGDGLSWVRGPAPFPDYLPGAIAGYTNSGGVVVPGSATYNLGASILHDQTGTAGTVNSATLTANFNNSSVSFNMAATSADGNWTATAGNIRMSQDGSFHAGTGGGPKTITSGTTVAPAGIHDGLSVTLASTSGTTTGSWGNIEGQLMGIGVGGAGVTYDLNSLLCVSAFCNNVTASGALAFSNATPYSTLTPYQLVAFASGMNAAGQIDSFENTRIQGGFVSPNRTQTVNGFPVKIDGDLPVAVTYNPPSGTTPGCTINCGPFVNDIPVVYTVAGATGPASIGTAALIESGVDLATGIRWGRYGAGTIGVNDRISGASLGTLDVTQQNAHFIMTNSQSGPTVLPVSGTFSYTLAGGTTPTDSNGNVGAALTAANASLSANFSTQKVDIGLNNLVVGGNTWSASATGIPILSNTFQADKKLGGGGSLNVTSSLGTNTAGSVGGAFTGATGNGVGMLYSLNHGGNTAVNAAAVTVSGVAAFKR